MTQIFGEPPSRARHARETHARHGAMQGVSREKLRQTKVLLELAPLLEEGLKNGTVNGHKAYLDAISDDRRPLYLKLPAWLDDKLKAEADRLCASRPQIVLELLAGYLTGDIS